jgi:hypothetical protein
MFNSNKTRTLLLTVLALLTLVSAANAYRPASSNAAGQPGQLSVVQSTSLAAMHPGDSAQTLSGSFDNADGDAIHVNTVTASVSVTEAAGAAAGTCDASDFILSHATMAVNADVAPGQATGAWTGATIRFNNKPDVNQDACKGATVKVSYATS